MAASLALGVRFIAGTAGSGVFTDGGAVTGYRSTSGLTSGKTYRYRAENAALSEWEWGTGVWNGTNLTRVVSFSSTGGTVAFTLAPQVAITIEPGDILSFADVMSLTGGEKIIGRGNIDAFGFLRRQAWSASGTYTPTAGMLFGIARGVAGGGGGGGCTGNSAGHWAGGGGGGGSYSEHLFTAADIGASKAVTIGAAGSGAAAGLNTGGAGGGTSLGSLMTTIGGPGGNPAGPANGPSATGGGGAGVGNIVAIPGWPGGTGLYAPTPNYAITNCGADSPLGAGAPPISPFGSGNGYSGSGYGSGGNGGFVNSTSSSSFAGGNGTAGFMVILEFSAA